MKFIKFREEFEAMLKEERAVLFVSFQWSRCCREVEASIAQWEKEVAGAAKPFPFYELDPDRCPFAWQWIGDNTIDLSTVTQFAGGVVWVSRGGVVGAVENTSFPGLQEVRRLTARWFGGAWADSNANSIDPELLKILCCPETHQGVRLAEPALVEKVNRQINQGVVRNCGGKLVAEAIEGGLVRADGKYLYPIRHNIPIMLVEEAIALELEHENHLPGMPEQNTYNRH